MKGSDRPGHEGKTSTANLFNKKPYMHSSVRHADPNGLETVSRYACALSCTCGHTWIAEEREACPECGEVGEWECAVRKLGEQSGERKSSGADAFVSSDIYGKDNRQHGRHQNLGKGDAGTAARFFPNPDWSLEVAERLAGADPVRYCAKASRSERDAGLNEWPEFTKHGFEGSDKNVPGYICSDGQVRSGQMQPRRCTHPTVKPLTLTKWLATLLLPPPEYAPRRLLVPFGGVCSEAIGALLAGWEHITVIEMSQEYCNIGEARVKFWQGWSEHTGKTEPKAILKVHKKATKKAIEGTKHIPLF